MNWKYWVMTKMKPNRVRKPAVTARLPPENRRLANTETSSIGCTRRRSHTANAISTPVASANPIYGVRADPSPVRRLDDGVDQGGHADRGQDKPAHIHRWSSWVPRGWYPQPATDDGHRGDRHVDPEDGAPCEMFEQPTAGNRSSGHTHTNHCGPQSDGLRTRDGLGEDVRDQGECGREDHRSADAHCSSGCDQAVCRAHLRGDGRGDREDGKPGTEPAASAVPIAEAPRREQQTGHHQGVGVDDPLQLSGVGVEFARQRWQCDVDDRGVHADDEDAQADDDQRRGRAIAKNRGAEVSSHRPNRKPDRQVFQALRLFTCRAGRVTPWLCGRATSRTAL